MNGTTYNGYPNFTTTETLEQRESLESLANAINVLLLDEVITKEDARHILIDEGWLRDPDADKDDE